jgi:hypothetical protein
VALLRALNPGVPIHGLFGGSGLASKRLLGLDDLYSSRNPTEWNWKHSDLVLAEWYREAGHAIPFDTLHLVEWDLLLVEPLESLYSAVPTGAVGLTALTPISELEDEWTWLRRRESRSEWEQLLAWARTDRGYDGVPHGCVGPGPCFPRGFLEAYAKLDPPLLGNDELRLPLAAQILGFPMVDTRLRGPWRGEREHPFFHFRANEIELTTIRTELAKPDGWRAFHPVRTRIAPDQLLMTPMP